jgi:imidazolonepropionase-like amidohydrolase
VQAGSDVFPFIPGVVPGAGLHDELRLLVRAGFRPEEALFAATTVPGRMLPGPRLGSLRVGGPADLLVFRADPTASLANLATLDVVVVDGRRYLREALSAHLRVQLDASRRFPFSFSARLLGWLISVVA